jgi:hypothetical protein
MSPHSHRIRLKTLLCSLGLAVAACRSADQPDLTGWGSATLLLEGAVAPGALSPLLEAWARRLRLLAGPEAGFIVASARPETPSGLPGPDGAGPATPPDPGRLRGEPFSLRLTLRLPPPCDEARLGALAAQLERRLLDEGGAGFHALDAAATARAADALRAAGAWVQDVSTAASHGGLVAVARAPGASEQAILEVAQRAAGPASRVVPLAEVAPGAGGPDGASFDLRLAVVARAPALGADAVASVDLADAEDGGARVILQFRAEAASALQALGEAHLGRHLPILDPSGGLLAAPRLASRLTEGRLELRVPRVLAGGRSPSAVAAALASPGLPSRPALHGWRGTCRDTRDGAPALVPLQPRP